ncbi:hypothetical protein MPH_12125 [Macrophomina phaseolina MS6]|uniref:HNH endonuclease n=2 Tax=Macrophomina phaseolina TaxID=35725 RepID=K2RCV4_MACPH|nr:hypothetical protein MPH_12125 [Macrophomina phaseolina MS6]KAH7039000.1 hypothetical protein B0J12DRAFT_243825 [Macrophomina phaseolina]
MIPTDEASNFSTFRDCLSDPVIRKLAIHPPKAPKRRVAKGRKAAIKPVYPKEVQDDARQSNDAEELGEFVEYLALEIFPSLPPELRTLSYSATQSDSSLTTTYADPLPPSTLDALLTPLPTSVPDSLLSYNLLPDASSLPSFLGPVLTAYIAATTAAPPVWAQTRASACELCERDWVPLTYHHLIPRQTHAKALKRGWAEAWELNKVAWLCRACHSYVHSVAGNEELAREWASVERLMSREDVQKWVKWVSRVRWKTR